MTEEERRANNAERNRRYRERHRERINATLSARRNTPAGKVQRSIQNRRDREAAGARGYKRPPRRD